MGLLRVELCYDDEAGNWHYRGPALHVNGGGTSTRDLQDFDTDAEAITLDVSVAPAA